jgi:hypothetical protein
MASGVLFLKGRAGQTLTINEGVDIMATITATEVKGAMIPDSIIQDGNKINSSIWLVFKYSNDDKKLPYKWPKAIKYQNKYFQWMSYNSDSMTINYKECDKNSFALPV